MLFLSPANWYLLILLNGTRFVNFNKCIMKKFTSLVRIIPLLWQIQRSLAVFNVCDPLQVVIGNNSSGSLYDTGLTTMLINRFSCLHERKSNLTKWYEENVILCWNIMSCTFFTSIGIHTRSRLSKKKWGKNKYYNLKFHLIL